MKELIESLKESFKSTIKDCLPCLFILFFICLLCMFFNTNSVQAVSWNFTDLDIPEPPVIYEQYERQYIIYSDNDGNYKALCWDNSFNEGTSIPDLIYYNGSYSDLKVENPTETEGNTYIYFYGGGTSGWTNIMHFRWFDYNLESNSWVQTDFQNTGKNGTICFSGIDLSKHLLASTIDLYYNPFYPDSLLANRLFYGSSTGYPVYLKLSVNPTDITTYMVMIKTQSFTDEFISNHKMYIRYPLSDGSTSNWVLCDRLSYNNEYFFSAYMNGTVYFKLTDLNNNSISTASVTITNIIESTTSDVDYDVLYPILHFEVSSNTVYVKTQDLDNSLINRYKCVFWSDVKGGDSTLPYECMPQDNENGTFHFEVSTTVDDTFYFQFYDYEKKKYSGTVSITVLVEEAIASSNSYDSSSTMNNLLHQKFGIFFSCFDFLSNFWNVISQKNPQCPTFNITFPEFLGGCTYSIIDFQFYSQYRNWIHYIIAGFCYFFFIKRMIKEIPYLIHR